MVAFLSLLSDASILSCVPLEYQITRGGGLYNALK